MAPLAEHEIEQRLAGSEWALAETGTLADSGMGAKRVSPASAAGECLPATAGSSIVREYKLADFAAAITFVNRVAELAEAADHHPDILLHGWNKVRLTLCTHSLGGLTDADFQLAGQIDRLV